MQTMCLIHLGQLLVVRSSVNRGRLGPAEKAFSVMEEKATIRTQPYSLRPPSEKSASPRLQRIPGLIETASQLQNAQ